MYCFEKNRCITSFVSLLDLDGSFGHDVKTCSVRIFIDGFFNKLSGMPLLLLFCSMLNRIHIVVMMWTIIRYSLFERCWSGIREALEWHADMLRCHKFSRWWYWYYIVLLMMWWTVVVAVLMRWSFDGVGNGDDADGL